MRALLPGIVALSLTVAGCAQAPLHAPADRAQLAHFAMDARFALSTSNERGERQNASGRLNWVHEANSDQILIANPLGMGIAEIVATPGNASLRTSDGRTFRAPDAEQLLDEITGLRLPISKLAEWLTGDSGGTAEADAWGRPKHLQEAQWTIEYFYESDASTAPPARLTIRHPPDIELKLRIESWRARP